MKQSNDRVEGRTSPPTFDTVQKVNERGTNAGEAIACNGAAMVAEEATSG